MAYPELWLAGLKPERGDRVPIREELVPTYHDGNLVQPQGNAIVNMDMNYNNSKLLFERSEEKLLTNGIIVMIGDYDTDPGVHPHDQVPIFKVRCVGRSYGGGEA
jgi:hypothetical protein